MEMLQGVWEQHLRPRAVVGYGVKIFLPSSPNCVTTSPGGNSTSFSCKFFLLWCEINMSAGHVSENALLSRRLRGSF